MPTSNTGDTDLVTRIVEHEFFAFQVQKAVRAQADAYLTSRARAAYFAVALTGALLTWLGVSKYYAFTEVVAGLETKSAELRDRADRLSNEAKRVEGLIATANHAVTQSKGLLDVAERNVSATRTISEGASNAARQTGDLAQAILAQAQSTQQNVQAGDKLLQQNLAQATVVLKDLRQEQTSLKSVHDEAVEIKRIRDEVAKRGNEILQTSDALNKKNALLEQGLHFEQELAKAKTFEILLIRDGHEATVVLPDFRRPTDDQARPPFRIRVKTHRIKSRVDFAVFVNDLPAQDFRGLNVGDARSLVDAPFSVRVDSIYHAKLAFDFVVLRLNPRDGNSPVPAPTVATARRLAGN